MAPALAGALLCLCTAAAPALSAEEQDAQRSSSWWSLWSWIDDVFGLSFGGITYGSGGADRIEGSDKLAHTVRAISGVRGIELGSPIELVVKQGAVEKLILHTDDNIAPLIESKVDENGILHIGLRSGANFRTRHALGATVELKELGTIKVSGPGDVTCAELDADRLEITLDGPGQVHIETLHSASIAVRLQGGGAVRLSGSSPKQEFLIEGGGELDAEELVGRAVAVRDLSSGKAKIWATESLSVEIVGSGDVRYRGQPALTTSLHGTGRLIHE
ncbi:MAG TPA: head GIN domain-containing protein [Burkholderiaceae bacterium]|nr:head GIN domain-containing protein [Burkholderiaceae bacterium]